MINQRADAQGALIVDAGIRLSTLWGCVAAWHYLRERGIGKQTALRVLSPGGQRRRSDAKHPAVRDAMAAVKESGVDDVDLRQRANLQPEADVTRRTNHICAAICDRAIEFSETHGSQYAESMLRIYGLKVPTIMRVLFEPRSRRRRH